MNDRSPNTFDVFLSYHWRDHAHVEALARRLREQSLRVFFDRWYLTPGQSWPKALEATLAQCRAVAVCIGQGEMGPWQQREKDLALERQVSVERGGQHFPVIPVLLPGAEPPLGFLSQQTWVDLRARVDDPVLLHTLVKAVHGEPPGPDAQAKVHKTLATICPYRGLLYFREEDAPFFFGRAEAITQLVGAVEQHNLVAVVGASGSGKSSVVRAGLVPELRKSRECVWEVVTIVPTDRPMQALAAGLLPLLEPDMRETDRLKETTNLAEALFPQAPDQKPVQLRDVVDRVLLKQPGTERLLLVVDQWEELFTLCKDDRARRCFIDNVLEATTTAKLSVVLTLRGDFFGRAITAYRALSDRVQGAQVNLGPMKKEELRLAIEKPAGKVELTFEPGLVELILEQAGDEPGHLPLLEFVLRQLWDHRRGGTLHHDAYRAIGQLEGAIAKKAETLYEKRNEEDRRKIQQIFLRLVRPGEGEADTRRRATLAELGETFQPLVKTLADERLLVTSQVTGSAEETIEVSHEALIRHWGQLKDWIEADRRFLAWQQRLGMALKEWEHNDRSEDLLLRGRPLDEALEWLENKSEYLSSAEHSFIEAGQNRRLREEQETQERTQQELLQAKRLAEEARKREEAERARADEQTRRLRAQKQAVRWAGIALFLLVCVGWGVWWLNREGVTVPYAWSIVLIRSGVEKIHKPEMIPIPGGEFQMGDVEGLGGESEKPVRTVTIEPFLLSIHEVTFEAFDQFVELTGHNLPKDEGWGRGKRPVIGVSWEDAQAYVTWLSSATGKSYRLPTEAEWEFAARFGDRQESWAGTSEENQLGNYAIYRENSGGKTAEVGSKQPNAFGVYDLSGNVGEWVEDCWHENYQGAPTDGSAWLKENGGDCGRRVLRGGSWLNKPEYLRSSNRYWNYSADRSYSIGFRLAQDTP